MPEPCAATATPPKVAVTIDPEGTSPSAKGCRIDQKATAGRADELVLVKVRGMIAEGAEPVSVTAGDVVNGEPVTPVWVAVSVML